MQPGVYVTAPAAAGSGISSSGTPYSLLQYNAAGTAQAIFDITDDSGNISMRLGNRRQLQKSNGTTAWDWESTPFPTPLNIVVGETPSGTVNGVNRDFTCNAAGATQCYNVAAYVNGFRVAITITALPNNVKLAIAPPIAATVVFDYYYFT